MYFMREINAWNQLFVQQSFERDKWYKILSKDWLYLEIDLSLCMEYLIISIKIYAFVQTCNIMAILI